MFDLLSPSLLTDSQRLARKTLTVSSRALGFAQVAAAARYSARIELDPQALEIAAKSRQVVEQLAEDSVPHYGVSTGFGALANEFISPKDRKLLQKNLIRSHAAGAGEEIDRESIRALMLLRIRTLLSGRTGVRPETIESYAAMFNAGITPVVREYGSLGCSGDLAPLAHCALALMGEGEVRDSQGRLKSSDRALAEAGLEPVELVEKEGLALINGTDGMLGMLVLNLVDFSNLLLCADVAAAMSVEALLGSSRVFSADLQELRPHVGQGVSAANLRRLLADSDIVASHATPDCPIVQDAYSLRCTPQVHGGVRDTVAYAARVAEIELGSAVDNPVVTPSGAVESNGNFHGAPVAYVLDFLSIVAADLASISERRLDRHLDPARSNDLAPFLAARSGVDSGLMIAQYTAAGIVSELKRLATPASVDSIPSSALQEDHVSMGFAAARKLRKGVAGLGRVLAIELMTAARSQALRAPLKPSPLTGLAAEFIYRATSLPGPDRFLSPEIEAVSEMVLDGQIAKICLQADPELA